MSGQFFLGFIKMVSIDKKFSLEQRPLKIINNDFLKSI